jgi:hypothetical protein
VDVDVPVYSKVEGILSAEEKKTAPKVEITLGFAAALTIAEQVQPARTQDSVLSFSHAHALFPVRHMHADRDDSMRVTIRSSM